MAARNLVVVIALALAPGLALCAEPHTIEEMTDPRGMTEAALSPDGKHIAAIIFDGYTHALIKIDTATRDVKLIRSGKRENKGHWSYFKAPVDVTWAGNDVVVVDYGLEAESMALDGKKISTLGKSVIGALTRGKHAGEVLVFKDTGEVTAARCNVVSGGCVKFPRPKGIPIKWAFDADGTLRSVSIVDSPLFKDASTVVNWYRPAGSAEWVKLAEFKITDDYWLPMYVPDEPDTLVVKSRIGRDTWALFNFDVKKLRETEMLAGHPTQDIASVGGVDKDAYDYVVTSGMLPQRVWFDAAWARMQKQVDVLLPNRINDISGDPAGSVLIRSYSDIDPGEFYFFDPAKRSLVSIGKFKPDLDSARMQPTEVISYKAADGLAIPAYLTRPAGKSGTVPGPLVVLLHGGPVARDHWGWNEEVQILAGSGYTVLQPQFRGSAGFGRAFEVAGFGQWGKAMQDDVTAGVEHLVKLGAADPKRVCIVGASYGGYAALWGMVKTPEQYRCAVSFAGVSDIKYMFSDWSDQSFDKRARELMRYRIGDERSDTDKLDQVSPLKHAAKIKGPVLLMHGREDDRVPVSHGKKMRDALEDNNKEVQWVQFNEEGHGLTLVANTQLYYHTMMAFLAKHLVMTPAPPASGAAPK